MNKYFRAYFDVRMSTQKVIPEISVTVSNIGGIDATERQLPPGVTVLSGENASNRSSFLRALATGLGADVATLKGDAPEGEISVQLGGETYTRTLRRRGQEIVYEGKPYLTEPEAITKAELFAFLLRNNPIRQFARTGDGGKLRDILMQPVDTDTIERQIDDLLRQKRELEDEREAAENAAQNLSALQRQRDALDDELESLSEEIETLEAEIQSFEQSLEAAEEENTELKEARSELNQLRQRRTTIERKLSRKEDEKEEVEADLAGLTAPDSDIESLEDRKALLDTDTSRLDDQIARIESEVKEPLVEIRGVVNELQTESSELMDALGYLPRDELGISEGPLADLTESESPTSQLVSDSQTCLACGSQVPSDQIEDLDAQYGQLISSVNTVLNKKRQERRSIETELDEIRNELSDVETYEQTKEDLERRRASLETDIDSLSAELAEVTEALEEQQTTVRELGQEENEELIELHEELASTRTKHEETQKQREEIESSITAAREQREEIQSLEADIETIDEEIGELRSRVGELERSLKEEFNEHIKQVIDILGYRNLKAIEIRDRKAKVREGRRTVEKTVFDLQITREGEDGLYQGELEQLSESETELVGLIIALSGYLVHEVGAICPVMILDSVDALDAKRLQRLLVYIGEHQEHLVTAVHPEDLEMFSAESSKLTVVEW